MIFGLRLCAVNVRADCRLFVVVALVAVGLKTACAQDIQADTANASDRSPTFRLGLSYASVWPLQYYRLSRFTFPYGGTADLTFQPDANGPLFIGFRVGLHRSDEARGTVENIRMGEKYNYTVLHSPVEIVMHQRTVEFQLMTRY